MASLEYRSQRYTGGVSGNILGSGGTGISVSGDADILLSSPATSFAIVATSEDTSGPRANFENRWEGIAFLLGAGTPDVDATSLLPSARENGSGGLEMTFTMLKPASTSPAVPSLEHSSDLGRNNLWAGIEVPAATGSVGGVSFTVTENTSDSTKNDVVATIPSIDNAVSGRLHGRLVAQE